MDSVLLGSSSGMRCLLSRWNVLSGIVGCFDAECEYFIYIRKARKIANNGEAGLEGDLELLARGKLHRLPRIVVTENWTVQLVLFNFLWL